MSSSTKPTTGALIKSEVKLEHTYAEGVGMGMLTDVRLITALTALLHNDPNFSSACAALSRRFGQANLSGREPMLRQCYDQWRTESEGIVRAARRVEIDGEVLEEVFEDALNPSASSSSSSSSKERLPKSSVQMLLSPPLATFYGGLSATKEQGLAAVQAHIAQNQLNAVDSKVIRCDNILYAIFQKQSFPMSELRAQVAAHMRPIDDLDGSKKRKRDESLAMRKAAKAEADRLNPPLPKVKAPPMPKVEKESKPPKEKKTAAKKPKVAKKDRKPRAVNPNSGLNAPP